MALLVLMLWVYFDESPALERQALDLLSPFARQNALVKACICVEVLDGYLLKCSGPASSNFGYSNPLPQWCSHCRHECDCYGICHWIQFESACVESCAAGFRYADTVQCFSAYGPGLCFLQTDIFPRLPPERYAAPFCPAKSAATLYGGKILDLG